MKKTLKYVLPAILAVVVIAVVGVLVLGKSPTIEIKTTTVAEETEFCAVEPDKNTANANWRIHQWYSSMTGTFVLTKDNKRGNKSDTNQCSYQLNCVSSYDEATSKIEILFAGKDGKQDLLLEDLDNTAMSSGKTVKVLVQSVRNTGAVDTVDLPVTESISFHSVKKGKLKIRLDNLTPYTAYHVTVTLAGTEEKLAVKNYQVVERYEAEDGKILDKLGTKVENNAFSNSSGVSSNEKAGAFLSIPFSVKENGTYKLTFSTSQDENTEIDYILDGVSYSTTLLGFQEMKTTAFSFTTELEIGNHSLQFKTAGNTVVVDFLDVGFVCGQLDEIPETTYLAEINHDLSSDVSSSLLLPVDNEGYYNVTFSFYVENSEEVPVTINDDGKSSIYLKNTGSDMVTFYLKKGINTIDLAYSKGNVINSAYAVPANAKDIENAQLPALGY